MSNSAAVADEPLSIDDKMMMAITECHTELLNEQNEKYEIILGNYFTNEGIFEEPGIKKSLEDTIFNYHTNAMKKMLDEKKYKAKSKEINKYFKSSMKGAGTAILGSILRIVADYESIPDEIDSVGIGLFLTGMGFWGYIQIKSLFSGLKSKKEKSNSDIGKEYIEGITSTPEESRELYSQTLGTMGSYFKMLKFVKDKVVSSHNLKEGDANLKITYLFAGKDEKEVNKNE